MSAFVRLLGRPIALAALGAACCGALLMPQPAHARVGVVFGFGAPLFYPPPLYYPPPAYYPPPPVYYAPPAPAWATPAPPAAYAPPPASPTGQSCYAGPMVCPMLRLGPSGRTCWCTDAAGRRVYGTAT